MSRFHRGEGGGIFFSDSESLALGIMMSPKSTRLSLIGKYYEESLSQNEWTISFQMLKKIKKLTLTS